MPELIPAWQRGRSFSEKLWPRNPRETDQTRPWDAKGDPGTAPIAAAGGTAARGDVNGQAKHCLKIIEHVISEAGGTMAQVIRTRIMLTDITRWRDAARAHGEVFSDARPACTFFQVSGFIDPRGRSKSKPVAESNIPCFSTTSMKVTAD